MNLLDFIKLISSINIVQRLLISSVESRALPKNCEGGVASVLTKRNSFSSRTREIVDVYAKVKKLPTELAVPQSETLYMALPTERFLYLSSYKYVLVRMIQKEDLIITRHAQEKMVIESISTEQIIEAIQRGSKFNQTDGLLAVYGYYSVAYKIIGSTFVIKTVFLNR